MRINWRAVITGFVVATVLGLFVAWTGPLTETSVYLLAVPGLAGGFVAGYMVSGAGNGALNGGLATVIGAVVLVVSVSLVGALFVGLVPAFAGIAIGLLALAVQAIPGAVAGAVGGWLKRRRTVRSTEGAAPR